MRTVALVGKSGTGKSYKAISLAHDKKIECIIDDGLLIKGNKILAGKSAKRQQTKIGAVKTALFSEDVHKDEIINAIEEHKPTGILVIGTSDKMVKKIQDRLGLTEFEEVVYIEEITTEKERDIADKQRNVQGKHIIPVPTFQLKSDFSGYFLDPLRIFRRKSDNSLHLSEKTVVRPTYSYLGKYIISDKVIEDIAEHVGYNNKGVISPLKISVKKVDTGIVIKTDVVFEYGYNIHDLAQKIQKQIKTEVDNMTALNVVAVNVCVKNLLVKESKKFKKFR